jgi:hypothetical protein
MRTNAGIISAEKRSNMVYYNLQCSCVLNIFSCVLDVIQSNIDSTKEMIE